MTITNLQDLCDFLSADSPELLNKRIYKATDCGASISVQTPDGEWHHNGGNWEGITEITAFTIQTIVEGSDATVDSDEFTLPVEGSEIDKWIEEMESQSSSLWEEANNPMCECGHRSDDHHWMDDPHAGIPGCVVGGKCLTAGCDCNKLTEIDGYDFPG